MARTATAATLEFHPGCKHRRGQNNAVFLVIRSHVGTSPAARTAVVDCVVIALWILTAEE